MKSQNFFSSFSLLLILTLITIIKTSSSISIEGTASHSKDESSADFKKVEKPFDTSIPEEFLDSCFKTMMSKAFSIIVDDGLLLNYETLKKAQEYEFQKFYFEHNILNRAKIEWVDKESLDLETLEYYTGKKLTNPVKIHFDGIKISNYTKNEIYLDSKGGSGPLLKEIYRTFKYQEDKDLSLEINNFINENNIKAPLKYYDFSGRFMETPMKIFEMGICIDFYTLYYEMEINKATGALKYPVTNEIFYLDEAEEDHDLTKEIKNFLDQCGEYKWYFKDLTCDYD